MDSASDQPSFHRFAKGRPQTLVFQEVRSDAVPAHERYEFWTGAILRGSDVPRPTEAQRTNFRATVKSLATASSELHWAEADGYGDTRTRAQIHADGLEDVAISYVLDGRIHAEYENDVGQVLEAGDFFLTDLSRPSRFHCEGRHQMVQVLLPRVLLKTVFPQRVPLPSSFTRALKASRLGPLLGTHLREVAALAAKLKPAEQAALLDITETYATTMIEGAFASALPRYESRTEGLYLAAERYIRRNLGKRDLAADEIAHAIGCSRATLYRVFRCYDQTVSGHIRELRLQRLMRLLRSAPAGPTIPVLAQRCGLYDAPNINQMFRKRFGVNPREVRDERSR